MVRLIATFVGWIVFVSSCAPHVLANQYLPTGVAAIDVTPEFPVRLSGYGNRRTEVGDVAGKLWVKALAIGTDDPAVLLTVDNCAVPAAVVDAVHAKLAGQIKRERLAVCSTHTHSAPALRGAIHNIVTPPVAEEHRAHIDKYTDFLIAKMVEATELALKDRQPAKLSVTQGRVGFAANRRAVKDKVWTGFGVTPNGPVDHDLPVIKIETPDGKLRALWAGYACHCTTLGGNFMRIHGDWAGDAQRILQERHPGSIALISIGCGADANPNPRDNIANSEQHGKALADEVDRLLKGGWTPLTSAPVCRLERIDLPLDRIPTKEQWDQRASSKNPAEAQQAQMELAALARGEPQRTTVPNYPVQCWSFGDDLAVVFLGGEVVVDYAIRLKTICDRSKLWVNAYSNDVPCYIASKRVIGEGGYEVDGSMIYYNQPGRLAASVEDQIIATVEKVVPERFRLKKLPADFPPPLSPIDSLAAIQVPPGLKVELVAAEPLVVDPIAFDWGPDGRLWVVEMGDYPNGLDGRGKAGGRIKVLEDTDGDGKFDRAAVFLDNLNFPMGVKVWRRGILIAAAPAILYAEDTKGTGRADHVEPIYTGFGEENPQHRVNGLRWGLDNWLYLGSGIGENGHIRSAKTGQEVAAHNLDFRIRPDTGELEAQSGHTQYGRERDDWGNWFGGDNTRPIWHYVLDDHYLRRNPHVPSPPVWAQFSQERSGGRVYPISKLLPRFNDFSHAGHFTSACSPVIMRDDLLGTEYRNNWLVCEPVHNLIHREIMEEQGVTFKSRRAPSENQSEFLRSTDPWFRPVMARVGPDGALYVADMYRLVIEHPKWIPPEWLSKLDVRAGDTLGRIYRIVPTDKPLRPIPRIDRLEIGELVMAMVSLNGPLRDVIQQELVWRNDRRAVIPLEIVAQYSVWPEVRLQAVATLDGLNALSREMLLAGLKDKHPNVRRNVVRLAERHFTDDRELGTKVAQMFSDDDIRVRQQVAYSLGQLDDRYAARSLGWLLARETDKHVAAAAVSSLKGNLDVVLNTAIDFGASLKTLEAIMFTLIGSGQHADLNRLWNQVAGLELAERVPFLSGILDAAERRSEPPRQLLGDRFNSLCEAAAAEVRSLLTSDSSATTNSAAFLSILGRSSDHRADDLNLLSDLISVRYPTELQSAAISQLARIKENQVPKLLLERLEVAGPLVREKLLDVMLTRPAWIPILVGHLESHSEAVRALSPARREQLLRTVNGETADRAKRILGTETVTDRRKIVERYSQQANSSKGDPARGASMFKERCASCHKLGTEGKEVGPDLVALADKSNEYLIQAILDPNSAVESRYISYSVATLDGRLHIGLIKSETSTTLTLVNTEGQEIVILRRDVDSMRSTGRTLMPEDLEKVLSPQDVADVLELIRKSAAKSKK